MNFRVALGWSASFAVGALAGCGGGQRDVVPETHDVTVAGVAASTDANGNAVGNDAGAAPSGEGDYVHLSRRRHGVVALAEARGFAPGEAERAVDRLADEMEACAQERERDGKWFKGAARVVVRVNPAGALDGLNVRAAPGPAVAANLLLCIVAPLKAMTFGPAAVRGFAIEAEWAPVAPVAEAASASPATTPAP